jgi:HSP20 family protein
VIKPTTPSTWRRSLDLPSRLFGEGVTGGDDYELYEEDGEFVLTVDLPGFDREEISLAWDDSQLAVSAEDVDESRDRKRTYYRRFRFPKDIDSDEITAEYGNGVLEVHLPVADGIGFQGQEIPIEG